MSNAARRSAWPSACVRSACTIRPERFAQPTDVDQFPRESAQAYLEDLAALAARHGIAIDNGSIVPWREDVGGFLHAYPIGNREVEVVRANLREALAQLQQRMMTADIAGITAHDLIRRLQQS